MGRSSSNRARRAGGRRKDTRNQMLNVDPERKAALDAAIKKRRAKMAIKKQNTGMNGKTEKKTIKKRTSNSSSVGSVDECLKKALEAIDTFNFDQAKKFCRKALEKDATNLQALELLGDLLAEEGEIETARECFNRAVEISPNAGYAKYMYLGQLSEGLEAVKHYEKGVHIMEQERDKCKQGDQAAGGDSAVSNLEISQAYTSIAEIYLTDACFEENAEQRCKECLDRALEENSRNAEAHQLMASFWLSKENNENAKASIVTSLSLWAKDDEDEGDSGDQEKQESGEKYPMTYLSRIESAKILTELEEYDKAESVLCGLLEESDEVVQVWYMLGLVQVQRNTEESKPYGRYYLHRAKKVFRATRCGDKPVLEHINELVKELGPGEGDKDGWLEKSQMEEEDLKELEEEDEDEDSSSEEETELMEP